MRLRKLAAQCGLDAVADGGAALLERPAHEAERQLGVPLLVAGDPSARCDDDRIAG